MTFVQGSTSRNLQPMFPGGQPISVLFLVENSSNMSRIWPSVFEKGLTPVANALTLASRASGQLSVVVLESFPSENGAGGMAPRQYSDCQTAFSYMRFNPHLENRISIGRITQSIELLEGVKPVGQAPSLHLVVVAASPPSDDEGGVPPTSDYSPWGFVSQRLASSKIHCHLVVTQEVATTSLSQLYEETLRRSENLVEERFSTSTGPSGILVRLATKPTEANYYNQSVINSSYAHQQTSRRNSYHTSDHMQANPVDTSGSYYASEPDTSPRLVSQLQSVHGLTKKKVYGTKPVREPFLGGEIREKIPPPPLTTATNAMMDMSSGGGRVITHSKLDRMGRLGQASPTDLHMRRPM